MEVFDFIRYALLVAEWVIVGLVFMVGFLLLIWGKKFGGVLMVVSLAYTTFLVLTPERLARSQKPLVETTIKGWEGALPPALVLHGNGSRDDVLDVLTLAETGLFRVFIARADGVSADETVLVSRPDCSRTRSVKNDFYPVKSGSLLFTARTGFTRCAVYVDGPVSVPLPRLDLWKNVSSSDQRNNEYITGIMTLVLKRDGREIEIARRIARQRVIQATRTGTYSIDPRPPFSESTAYQEYDPDVLEFTLTALRKDWRTLPTDSLPDAELVEKSDVIIQNAGTDEQKIRVAFALAGAIHGDAVKSRAILSKATDAIDAFHSRFNRDYPMKVRGHSDCWTSLQAASGRSALVSACLKVATRKPTPKDCMLPESDDALEEWCTDIRHNTWVGSEKGARVLVVRDGLFSAYSNSHIAEYGDSAELRRVAIPSDSGLIDLALDSTKSMGARSILWVLEGNLGCVDRVTVIGKYSGVIGIDAGRVQFRSRFDTLDNILGMKPEASFETAPNTTTVVSGDRLHSLPCRNVAPVAAKLQIDPDQVVTRLPYIVFGTP